MIKINKRKVKGVFQKEISSRVSKSNLFKILIVLMVMLISGTTVNAASTLKLYYNKKNANYTGQQVTYKLNEQRINNSKYPGIIIDGTSLVPGYDVFNNKLVGSNFTYSSKTGAITIKKDNIVVRMTENSKTAYINGVKKYTSLAPVLVKYSSTGVSKILIPARFVSEALGFTYSWNSSTSTATLKTSSVKPLTLYYDNKLSIYTGTQGAVSINGKKVDLANMPSIIINDTAMLNAWRVFSNSSIKASYSYSAATKKVTLKKGDNVVVLTLGSKKALVNGATKTMSEAPRLLTNKNINKTYLIVPGYSVANYLGYNYSWNSKTKTSEITTKVVIKDPELDGDDTSPLNPDKTYIIHSILPNLEAEYNALKSMTNTNIEGVSGSVGSIISVSQDNMAAYPNKNVYVISSSAPFSNISSSYQDESTISINASNTIAANTSYVMNPGLVNQVVTSYDTTTNSTNLLLSLATKNSKYDITLSPDKYTMYVNVYNNYISKLEAGYKANNDTISLSSLNMLDADITEDSTHVYLDFPYTINGIGEQNSVISDGYCVKEISVMSPTPDSTRITITKTNTSDYVVSNTGSNFTITLFDETVTNYSIMIKKPVGMVETDITDEDLYYKNQFKVTVPGNQIQYYQENPIINTNSVVTGISCSLNSQGNTDIIIKTSKIQGYKYSVQNEYIAVLVGNPKDIYDNIVVLDAGHGGTDPGAQYGGYSEKNINYKIMVTNAMKYFNSKESNIKAYWTRYNDTLISLDNRAAYAKKLGADLFVSLHMNSASSKSANGMEAYYSSYNGATTDAGLTSKKLATIFASKLSNELGINNRGAKDSIFVVVKKNTVPAILIELGFMSNANDLDNITDPTFQNDTAKAIFDTTQYVFDQYPTGR